jgi:hypothetical protein
MYNYSLHGGWALWGPYLVSGVMTGGVFFQALYYERRRAGGEATAIDAAKEGLLEADDAAIKASLKGPGEGEGR